MYKKISLLLLTMSLAFQTAFANELLHINVNQVEHNLPDMRVYFNVYDENDNVIYKKFSTQDIAVHVDGKKYTGDDLSISASAASQKNCLFLVDVSTSVTEEQMREIKKFITDWTVSMSKDDTVGIITFGETITVVQDLVSDKDKILKKVETLALGENATAFYNGIEKGVQMLSQHQSLGQNMIIMFSDGENYFVGGKTRGEVTDLLKDANIPLYSIGTVLAPKEEQQINLDEMAVLTRQSSGRYFQQSDINISDVYGQIKDMLGKQQIVEFKVKDMAADYMTKDLSLEVTTGGKRMVGQKSFVNDTAFVQNSDAARQTDNASDDNDTNRAAETFGEGVTHSLEMTSDDDVESTPDDGALTHLDKLFSPIGGFGAIALLAGGFFFMLYRRNKLKNLNVELIYQSPNMTSFKMHDVKIYSESITIGTGLGSTLLIDERVAGKKHAMIYYERGKILIEDFNTRAGTLLNGNPLTSIVELKDGDKIKIGSTEFEVIISAD